MSRLGFWRQHPGYHFANPIFDPDCPSTWFLQFENILRTKGITKRTTWFRYAAGSLPGSIVNQICNIIDKQADINFYERLKQAVISRYTSSQHGDRSPSQLLSHIRSLASINAIKTSPSASIENNQLEAIVDQLKSLTILIKDVIAKV
ncbi:unnamed protein product [Rodentolepis nana]|uniref:HEPN_Swt1 domain-containing protein n=1 Tax=Rodentolepis nana TaxID=102285 RepID=A0A158QJC3_RODNA|nr:unnamed protein product [Rodentolepis nana]